MAEEQPNFTIRLAKIKNNRLLDRVQMVCDVFYEPRTKVTKEHIRKKIAQQFKKPNVVIFSAKKAFGGGRIRCFAMVYDSEDSMKKYESAKRLARIERNQFSFFHLHLYKPRVLIHLIFFLNQFHHKYFLFSFLLKEQ